MQRPQDPDRSSPNNTATRASASEGRSHERAHGPSDAARVSAHDAPRPHAAPRERLGRRTAHVLVALIALVAFALRALAALRAGPLEGGADEWYSAYRALSALVDRANPGDFMHPALGYLAFAIALAARAFLSRPAPLFAHEPLQTRAVADFIANERAVLQTLQASSALVSALTVVATYRLARVLSASRAASLVAATALALTRLHLEYGQRVRVDALFTLCTTIALSRVLVAAQAARRRDALVAGALVGLATSANYPGALLVVPLVWACAHGARRAGAALSSSLVRAALGLVAAATAFFATNPYLLLRYEDAHRGVRYQLSYATRVHPGQGPPSPAYYLSTIAQQGSLLALIFALSVLYALARRPRGAPIERALALAALGYIAVFTVLRTQFDRYVLPALPWLCALVAPAYDALTAHAAGRLRARPRLRALAPFAAPALVVFTLASTALRAALAERPPGPVDPRGALTRWILANAGARDTLWLQADRAPLVQALYADAPVVVTTASDPLVALARGVVSRQYPQFAPRVLKGEFVAQLRHLHPDELAAQRVSLLVACPEEHRARPPRSLRRAAEPPRDPSAPGPYAALLREASRVGVLVYTPGDECVVLRLRPPAPAAPAAL